MHGDRQIVAAAGQVHQLRLLGERLCLDFANTVDPRHSDHPREFLTSYADLVAWAAYAGAIEAEDAARLLEQATHRPAEADLAFQSARTLRQALYRVFSAIAAGEVASTADVDVLTHAHVDAMTHARIAVLPSGYAWSWDRAPQALDRMVWPVARSATELLTTGQLDRVRECPGLDGCGWLFYDTSKNGSRRWCSMEGCGNRAKGRRHYWRSRGSGTS